MQSDALPCFQRHQVHAVPPADVPAGDPVHLQVLGQVILPGEEAVVTIKLSMLDTVCTVPWVGQAQCTLSGVILLRMDTNM